jgi:hypothetical protein
MGDAEVKDQAPAPGLIPTIVAYLHIAAPLACACRDSRYRICFFFVISYPFERLSD